jgi:hypothetical protein
MKLPTVQQLKPIASGFVFGAAIGVLLGLWGMQAQQLYSGMMNGFGINFTLSSRAHMQYCNADYDGARTALLAWLGHLDAQKPHSDPPQPDEDPLMAPKFVAADKTIVLGQLALLEERHGDRARAKEYWKQAESAAKTAEWKDYSEGRIRSFVDDPKYCKAPEPTTQPKVESPKP